MERVVWAASSNEPVKLSEYEVVGHNVGIYLACMIGLQVKSEISIGEPILYAYEGWLTFFLQ
jgi:hypothetical protein